VTGYKKNLTNLQTKRLRTDANYNIDDSEMQHVSKIRKVAVINGSI